MDLDTIRQIIQLMVDNDLSELDLHRDDTVIRIRRGGTAAVAANHHVLPYAPAPVAVATPPPAAAPHGPPPGLVAIESPMVGTFYSAANPDSPPFIKPGSQISPDSTVCLIEAMKVFNEIKAEKSGVVEQVLVKNGEAVEFGQKLFLVRPA